jgi:opacity protein-like surface antigen
MKHIILTLIATAATILPAFGQFWDDVNAMPKHRLSLSIYPSTVIMPNRYYWDDGDNYFFNSGFTATFGYGQRIKSWLEVGMDVTLSSLPIAENSDYEYDPYSYHAKPSSNEYYFSIMPTARLFWIRGKNASVYSGVGVGFRYVTYKGNFKTGAGIAFNVIPLGVSVGKGRVYGFWEVALTSSGLGIGIRFN